MTNRIILEYKGTKYAVAFEDMENSTDPVTIALLVKNTLKDIYLEEGK